MNRLELRTMFEAGAVFTLQFCPGGNVAAVPEAILHSAIDYAGDRIGPVGAIEMREPRGEVPCEIHHKLLANPKRQDVKLRFADGEHRSQKRKGL